MTKRLPLPVLGSEPNAIETGSRDPEREQRLRLHHLRCHLERQLGRTVEIVVTDNTRSMVSVKRSPERFSFRLHHMFLNSDLPIINALVDFARIDSAWSRERIRNFIDKNRERVRPRVRRKPRLVPTGSAFDLQQMSARVNEQYFAGELADVLITWGRYGKPRGKKRQTIRLGAFFPRQGLIRIHPILDNHRVPEYFVESVVHHEMVHAWLHRVRTQPSARKHCSRFRELEQQFEHYDAARAWEIEHLPSLIELD